MILKIVILSAACLAFVAADCNTNMFPKSTCCTGLWDPAITQQIQDELEYCRENVTVPESETCNNLMCRFECTGIGLDAMDHCGNLLYQPAMNFILNYVKPDWAVNLVTSIQRKCLSKARNANFADVDGGVYSCSAQAYYFTLCLYDTYNSVCPILSRTYAPGCTYLALA